MDLQVVRRRPSPVRGIVVRLGIVIISLGVIITGVLRRRSHCSGRRRRSPGGWCICHSLTAGEVDTTAEIGAAANLAGFQDLHTHKWIWAVASITAAFGIQGRAALLLAAAESCMAIAGRTTTCARICRCASARTAVLLGITAVTTNWSH